MLARMCALEHIRALTENTLTCMDMYMNVCRYEFLFSMLQMIALKTNDCIKLAATAPVKFQDSRKIEHIKLPVLISLQREKNARTHCPVSPPIQMLLQQL